MIKRPLKRFYGRKRVSLRIYEYSKKGRFAAACGVVDYSISYNTGKFAVPDVNIVEVLELGAQFVRA